MPAQHKVVIIAKERPFDEEKWKELLTAFAYVLHERRKAYDKQQPGSTPDAPNPSEGIS